MIEFKVSAPGKLILYGEHSVVYGKTAVAGSLNLQTILQFEELYNSKSIILSMPKIELQIEIPINEIKIYFENELTPSFENNHNQFYIYIQNFIEKYIKYSNNQQKTALEAFFYLFIATVQIENLEIKPFKCFIDTELTISSGLGSSASFAVCITSCFIHWNNLQKNVVTNLEDELDKISKYAISCEKIMHGTPSGIDNAVCTYGSIIKFKKGTKIEPIYKIKQLKVLLVNTQIQRSTKLLVDKLFKLQKQFPNIYLPIFEAMDNISEEALAILRKFKDLSSNQLIESYHQLMTLIDINQGLLSTCQVSNSSIDWICSEAKKMNLSAKLTGAGGGGYVYILLLPDTSSDVIDKLSMKLNHAGYSVTLTNLGGPGVQIY